MTHDSAVRDADVDETRQARYDRARARMDTTGIVPILHVFADKLRGNPESGRSDPTVVIDFGLLPRRRGDPVAAAALRWGAVPLLRRGGTEPYINGPGDEETYLWTSHVVRVDERGELTFLVAGRGRALEDGFDEATPGRINEAIGATSARAHDFRTGTSPDTLNGSPGLGIIGRRVWTR